MTFDLVPGSIAAVAEASGRSLAETMLRVEAVVLVDTSGSMNARDSRNGQRRYDVACQELAGLQRQMPGKLAIVSFSSYAAVCPTGTPDFLNGSTDLAGALTFAGMFDVDGIRFVVVSDGEPDSEQDALAAAAKIKGRIDTIYVGPEDGRGREFLARLARASRGQAVAAERVMELASAATLLLSGAQ